MADVKQPSVEVNNNNKRKAEAHRPPLRRTAKKKKGLFQDLTADESKEFRAKVCHIMGVADPATDRLPGPMPMPLSRKHLKYIQTNYAVTEKSDGDRTMLFSHQGRVYLIDRRFRFRALREDIAKLYATTLDTLLDGEYVYIGEGKPMMYFVFDAVMTNGVDVRAGNLPDRLGAVNGHYLMNFRSVNAKVFDRATHSDYLVTTGMPFLVCLKTYYDGSRADKALSNIILQTGSHYSVLKLEFGDVVSRNDGLIFVKTDEPYVPSSMDSLLKWKWPENNTADFLIKAPFPSALPASDIKLYAKGDLHVTTTTMPDRPGEQYFMRQQLGEHKEEQQLVVECRYNGAEDIWEMLKVRADKNEANNVRTILSVLETAIQNIKAFELTHVDENVVASSSSR